MLIAHLVPGYFAAIKSQPSWNPEWTTNRQFLLWAAALGSTVAPDIDVIYNAFFQGFINHSTLWTHSLVPHLGVGLAWLILRDVKRWPFLQGLVGLIAIGGVSHLVLDVIAHGTPLLYPYSLIMVGLPPARVVEGGIWAYLTDPIFLLEPFALSLAAWHWILKQNFRPRVQIVLLTGLLIGLISFLVTFLWWLPDLQALVASVTGISVSLKSEWLSSGH